MDDAQGKVRRINGDLHEVTPVHDEDGKVVTHDVKRLHLELTLRDRVQILVGAAVLAIPTAFTEEVWNMGSELSWFSVAVLSAMSLVFIGLFIYLNCYQRHMEVYRGQFLNRLFSTYVFSLMVMGVLLLVVGKAPWLTDTSLALKRTIIGALPASMSATVTDAIT
jgi:uncharacterized membrane protein